MARLENICDLITELFKEYDTDSDGKLSKEEVEKLVENEVTDDEIKVRNSTHSRCMTQLQYAHTWHIHSFSCFLFTTHTFLML